MPTREVLTDVIARFGGQMGERCTCPHGVDEHGQKVAAGARKKASRPEHFVDAGPHGVPRVACRSSIISMRRLHCAHDPPPEGRGAILQQLFDKGEIYKAEYQGFYSTRQEQFCRTRIAMKRAPGGDFRRSGPRIVGGERHFFKLQQYQEWLVKFLADNPTHLSGLPPESRSPSSSRSRSTICASRARKSAWKWGIPLPFDEGYVTYVWFDALPQLLLGGRGPAGDLARGAPLIARTSSCRPHARLLADHAARGGHPAAQGIIAHGWWLQRGARCRRAPATPSTRSTSSPSFGVDAFR